MAIPRAGFNPRDAWNALRSESSFDPSHLLPYMLFPLDQRWIYYESRGKLLNRHRPEFGDNLNANEFLLAVPQPRRVSEARPLFSRSLVDLHAHDVGCACFPREAHFSALTTARVANIAPKAWKAASNAFSLSGDRESSNAKAFVSSLIRCTLAFGHARRYESDHREALAHDWAHVPIPRDRAIFERAALLGGKIALLLDAQADPMPVLLEVLGRDRVRALGAIVSPPRTAVDLRVTISYFGAAKGRWLERAFSDSELPLEAWGSMTGDLYLNRGVCLSNVPSAVWRYELGGYPVIRKWLGHRHADRRGGSPLSTDEAQYLRSIIQRLAGLMALQPQLDQAYEDAAACAFTGEELGLR